MARIDDFKQARALSIKDLSEMDPDLIANLSGASIESDAGGVKALSLKCLNRELTISWPDLEFLYEGTDEEVSIQQQVLILHYLNGAFVSKGAAITGEWTSFQDVPDGRFYMDAFIKRAKEPLLRTFGNNPGQMVELATNAYGASPLDYGDFSVIVKALPLAPVALVIWEGDDEFPPDGNILFDKNITMILSAEDIAWLAGMVVYPLMGMAKR
ncbi:DUF3786 domain-containing protein [Deltaproteobacteria bacterium]|nr:DUF3786 domain-containing protein [Deltaproteobacteria bacterium]